MKIAIDVRTAAGEKTGKGWYTFYLVHALIDLDRQNEYFLYSREKIPGLDKRKNVTQKIIRSKGFLWHMRLVIDILRNNIDVFFSPTSYITPVLLPAKIRKIITVHDLVAFHFSEKHNKKAVFLEKIFLNLALRKSAKVICVSKNTRNDLLKKFNVDQNKIAVIYCGAADIFAGSLSREIELRDFALKTNLPKKFFLAVGTIEPRKNYVNLISAFKKVLKRFPDCHLIIVGGKGWQYEKVFRLFKFQDLAAKVHFLGYLSNASLVNLYNLATALVFPSLYEGFGIPPLEAMRCGCPVITSNISSLPEVVGDAALLVNPHNVDEIAAAMVKMLKNPAMREEMAKKGLAQAQKFSWEKAAGELLGCFGANGAST